MLYEFALNINYKDPIGLLKYTNDFPDVNVDLWCNSWLDVISLSNLNVKAFDTDLNFIESYFGKISILNHQPEKFSALIKLVQCAPRPIDDILPKYQCIELPPTHYSFNSEYIHLLVSNEVGNQLLTELESLSVVDSIEIISMAPFKSTDEKYPIYLPISHILSELTEKQMRSILHAVEHGYYDIPRKIKTEELAKNFGIGRRTYEEHLRKAENKIINMITPVMLFNIKKI